MTSSDFKIALENRQLREFRDRGELREGAGRQPSQTVWNRLHRKCFFVMLTSFL